jgi:hypothetical protein
LHPDFVKRTTTMAVTRLKRKAKRNKNRASARVAKIKRLNKKPVIEQVDIEAIKEEFAKKAAKSSPKATKKEEKVEKEEKKEKEEKPAKEATKDKKEE